MRFTKAWDWPEATRWQRGCLGAGAVGGLVLLLGLLIDHERFFRSYLIGYFGWLGIALGSLAIWMIHQLTGGQWGMAIRRILEAAARTLPLLALLFMPIALGATSIYPWAHGDSAEHAARAAYLNVPFFLGRAACYFVIWIGLVLWFGRCANDSALQQRAQSLSGIGLVILAVTFTLAAIDWLMSLEPEWSSTIFGALIGTGQLLPALALAIVIATWLADQQPLAEIATPDVWNDLGNLLLAFVMMWTYMAFSQYLLIWSGNLPEEITWYLARTTGGWSWLAVALGFFYFAFPFLMLLSRGRKRDPRRLRHVALLVLVMHFVNQFWTIAPAFAPGRFSLHWLDGAASMAIGGVWIAVFLWNLQARSLAAVGPVPTLVEVTQHA